ncbi:MAG: hypothetical protein ABIQ35_08950, partial [Verrucomicrobiota bacterium]
PSGWRKLIVFDGFASKIRELSPVSRSQTAGGVWEFSFGVCKFANAVFIIASGVSKVVFVNSRSAHASTNHSVAR